MYCVPVYGTIFNGECWRHEQSDEPDPIYRIIYRDIDYVTEYMYQFHLGCSDTPNSLEFIEYTYTGVGCVELRTSAFKVDTYDFTIESFRMDSMYAYGHNTFPI